MLDVLPFYEPSKRWEWFGETAMQDTEVTPSPSGHADNPGRAAGSEPSHAWLQRGWPLPPGVQPALLGRPVAHAMPIPGAEGTELNEGRLRRRPLGATMVLAHPTGAGAGVEEAASIGMFPMEAPP
jgi:hypothetical protein